MGAEQSSQLGSEELQASSKVDHIDFSINGKPYKVDVSKDGASGESRLVDFIRDKANLKGTKYMCREGGCGACVVSVKKKDGGTGDPIVRAVNSCLTPLLSCDGWEISTIEQLGNNKVGYHEIQKQMVKFSATQCGYCSPGMAMHMYSLLESKKGLKSKEIEDSLDGNICRCTGYRPILDAFKSFATDASGDILKKSYDIEDCITCPMKQTRSNSQDNFEVIPPGGVGGGCCQQQSRLLLKTENGEIWTRPLTLEEAYAAFAQLEKDNLNYRVVAGNTNTGIFKDGIENPPKEIKVFVDITSIPDLYKITVADNEVVLGGAVTLSNTIATLEQIAANKKDGFNYADDVAKHIRRIANTPVRNVGSIAGNLMIKYNHNEFPSDLFTMMETIGAQVKIGWGTNSTTMVSVGQLLSENMKGRLILSLHLPQLKGNYIYRSYKISKRFQNAHAYVNAGFLFNLDNQMKVIGKPRIVYGGIHPTFVHATNTETFLEGKSLNDPQIVQQAMGMLNNELNPDAQPQDASPEYRKKLAEGLLYKTVLFILGGKATPKLQSGGQNIERKTTSGKQTFDPSPETDWPLYKPMPKMEAIAQCSGEAEFVNDIPHRPDELYAAFVLSSVANADIKSIDPSKALAMPGVVKFIQAKDIPGQNTYLPTDALPGYPVLPEEIFASTKVMFAGEAVGLIVAETMECALKAAKAVNVEYANVKKPVLKIKDAIKMKAEENAHLKSTVTNGLGSSLGAGTHKIKGEIEIGSQYHFHMETQVALCIPTEDGGMDVYAATQWMAICQWAISLALNIPNHKINVQVRRLGGGFGGKANKSAQIAVAAAIGAYFTNKPVRLVLDLETNMELVGKRFPYLTEYETSFDDNGKILDMKAKLTCDTGGNPNLPTSYFAAMLFRNAYDGAKWNVEHSNVITNTTPQTWCRAPGTTQGIASIEIVMDHIAQTLNKDPLEVREANFIVPGNELLTDPLDYTKTRTFTDDKDIMLKMCHEMEKTADLDARRKFNANFNENNRWRKRGLSVVPMRYPVEYTPLFGFPLQVSIYFPDGSVAVSCGGIEMGQGLNTKVAQTVAKMLGVPFEKVSVKPANNFTGANSLVTGGSTASELCCYAATKACQILVERMKPVKEKMKDPAWDLLVQTCVGTGINLSASYMQTANDGLKTYDIWAVNVTEVEVDILTGENKIVRLDIIEDAGKSLNPDIDIGQVEGALVMGLGFWTTEKISHDPITGKILTKNTWEYKPPEPKDIPEDMRITLLKDAPNPLGVLKSKATGEPAFCTSVAVLLAIRQAIQAARKDAGNTEWFQINGPVTPEDIVRLSLTDSTQFQL